MDIVVVGLNHKTAPVEVRERFSFREAELEAALCELKSSGAISECLILSTCNRVEVYGVGEDRDRVENSIRDFLAGFRNTALKERIDKYCFVFSNKGCIRHLFLVASGLDSMVIGETEILGQVKRAYEVAYLAGATGKFLNILLQRSFKVAKCVRTNTPITAGALSVGSAAVELAERVFNGLGGKRLLIFGAGKMCEVALNHLLSHGVSSIIVSNRSYERALELASSFKAKAINFKEGLHELLNADIVISATASPHYIIRESLVRGVMSKRNGQPLFFIDIAVPRDVEPSVGEIEGVHLYDIDDLKSIIDTNLRERQKAFKAGLPIIEGAVEKFTEIYNRDKGKQPCPCSDKRVCQPA